MCLKQKLGFLELFLYILLCHSNFISKKRASWLVLRTKKLKVLKMKVVQHLSSGPCIVYFTHTQQGALQRHLKLMQPPNNTSGCTWIWSACRTDQHWQGLTFLTRSLWSTFAPLMSNFLCEGEPISPSSVFPEKLWLTVWSHNVIDPVSARP